MATRSGRAPTSPIHRRSYVRPFSRDTMARTVPALARTVVNPGAATGAHSSPWAWAVAQKAGKSEGP